MADRDIIELQEQGDMYTRDDSVETVTGAGREGVIAAAIELRQQRVLVAEERMLQDQQVTVEDLQRQLNEALARVDHLSADLAKERSLYDV